MIRDLFTRLWVDYAAITPQAAKIHQLLTGRGERIENDHVALRTFAAPGIDIEDIDRAFVSAGYAPIESYRFDEKKLDACHYEHSNPAMPRVFISALDLGELSEPTRETVRSLAEQVPSAAAADPMFAASGRRWKLDIATYEALRSESEYAAWVAAFGFRANHFTVSFNALETFDSLASLDDFLIASGFPLNESGGRIKGSPQQHLEQSSTLADLVETQLDDGLVTIPGCYYEFARRYPLADGKLFSGFVAASADKIFESTDPV